MSLGDDGSHRSENPGSVRSEAGSRIILASASPRRRELLEHLGVRFVVVVSRFREESLAHLTDPEEYVLAAASGKAEEVARRRDGIVLGVDTDVVAPEGDILGKPTDPEDAVRLLTRLSGRTHRVYSAVVLIRSQMGTILDRTSSLVQTEVTFVPLNEQAIRRYVATGEPLDKAGAYGIQSGGLPFVSHINGDLSNVIGLPLPTVAIMLEKFGVPLWESKD
ncbi:MAG: Maf family protein [Capsulimonadales bacterium]|nr:Maf family protein [Capsulimonadales bacterium]